MVLRNMGRDRGRSVPARRKRRGLLYRLKVNDLSPTITTAQRIRFDPNDGRRVAIEARALAGYPPQTIAEMGTLDPAVVYVYLALFFDVLDRIDAADFIWSQVVGFQNGGDDEQGEERKAMLWLSWIGGPLIADALLLPGRSVGFAEREEGIGDHLMETMQAQVTRAMALAPFLGRLDREQARQFTRWPGKLAGNSDAPSNG